MRSVGVFIVMMVSFFTGGAIVFANGPGSPVGVRVVEISGTYATTHLTWDIFVKGLPPDDREPTEIVIRCGVSISALTITKTIPASQPSIALKDLLPKPGKYYCTITGKDAEGEGAASVEFPFAAKGGNLVAYKNVRLK